MTITGLALAAASLGNNNNFLLGLDGQPVSSFSPMAPPVTRKHGDPFPLPRPAQFGAGAARLTPEQQRVDWCLRSLNLLAAPARNSQRQSIGDRRPLTAVQQVAVEEITIAVREAGEPPAGMTEDVALSEMLASKTVYNAEPANLAPFCLE